jgi:hypothetical protein
MTIPNKKFFLTIAFTLMTSLAFSWQAAFQEKVRLNEQPEWMLKQIRLDLEPFVKTGISKKQIDLVMNLHTLLNRFEIRGNQVFVNGQVCVSGKEIKGGKSFINAICQLAELVPLPYIDFVISFNDSFYHVPALSSCKGPLFSFAKRSQDRGIILIPDHAALAGYIEEKEELEKGNTSYPWHLKKNKALWRGVNSGFLPGSLDFMNPNNFQQYPRVILCKLSKENSDLLDAGFTSLTHVGLQMKEILNRLGYVKDYVSISEHLKYKYQILIDGYTCAWHRGYWQLFSNCVMIKQTSPDFQWYYGELEPYVHFIPVDNQLNDLIEKIKWAQQHDNEVKQIVQNANHFADTHLNYEDIMLYIYLLLTEYAKLLNADYTPFN